MQPTDVQRPAWSALGHAIDYRLRLSFGGQLEPAVSLGVAMLDGAEPFHGAPAPPVRRALFEAGRQLLAAVDTYLAVPDRQDEQTVARLCFVAAFYENLARNGHIRRSSMLTAATPATTLTDLTAAVPSYAIDDLAAQMRLTEQPLTALRALPPQARVCGPVFAGSGDIGGADADFILGGLLLDCKATTRPRKLGRDEIYQLAGYLLLDYDDQFGIDRVGRQGSGPVALLGRCHRALGLGDVYCTHAAPTFPERGEGPRPMTQLKRPADAGCTRTSCRAGCANGC